jgi:hypothetical protein
MRTTQLHNSILQKSFTFYIGEDNPELQDKFQP